MAVAQGILTESLIANLIGKLNKANLDTIFNVFKKLEITPKLLKNLNLEDVIRAILGDKKNKDGDIYCVILSDIGEVALENSMVATKISLETLKTSLQKICCVSLASSKK